MKTRDTLKSRPWKFAFAHQLLTDFVYVLSVYDASKVTGKHSESDC